MFGLKRKFKHCPFCDARLPINSIGCMYCMRIVTPKQVKMVKDQQPKWWQLSECPFCHQKLILPHEGVMCPGCHRFLTIDGVVAIESKKINEERARKEAKRAAKQRNRDAWFDFLYKTDVSRSLRKLTRK